MLGYLISNLFEAKSLDESLYVTIKGLSIPNSFQSQITLLEDAALTKAKGVGIGLPICKRLVDAHSGCVEVESEEGKGLPFTVKLSIR